MSKYLFYFILCLFTIILIRQPPQFANSQPYSSDTLKKTAAVIQAEKKLDEIYDSLDKKIDKAIESTDYIEENTRRALKASNNIKIQVKPKIVKVIDTVIIDTLVVTDTLFFPNPTTFIPTQKTVNLDSNKTWWGNYLCINDTMLRECTLHKKIIKIVDRIKHPRTKAGRILKKILILK